MFRISGVVRVHSFPFQKTHDFGWHYYPDILARCSNPTGPARQKGLISQIPWFRSQFLDYSGKICPGPFSASLQSNQALIQVKLKRNNIINPNKSNSSKEEGGCGMQGRAVIGNDPCDVLGHLFLVISCLIRNAEIFLFIFQDVA